MIIRYIINRISIGYFLYEKYLTWMSRKASKKLVLHTRFFQRLTTHPSEIFFISFDYLLFITWFDMVMVTE